MLINVLSSSMEELSRELIAAMVEIVAIRSHPLYPKKRLATTHRAVCVLLVKKDEESETNGMMKAAVGMLR